MRALVSKYAGASRVSTRLLDFWRLLVVGPLVFFEIFFTTALFDFYVPADFPVWQNPVLYTNALAKVTVLASILLVPVAWPRREEIKDPLRRCRRPWTDGECARKRSPVCFLTWV